MEGYKIPPVMFTESQANALILAEKLVLKSKDSSFIKDYTEAVEKIKSVLNYTIKDRINLLSERTISGENLEKLINSDTISDLQLAITSFNITEIEYTNEMGKSTKRLIEPFALIRTENWLLVAWCRLRNEIRFFRLDRIHKMKTLPEKFQPHNLTLQEFFDKH